VKNSFSVNLQTKLLSKPVQHISLALTRNDKNIKMFNVSPSKLYLSKRVKGKSQKQRFEKVDIHFANKVIIKGIEITSDGSRLEIIGHTHFLNPQIQHIKPAFVELTAYYEKVNKRKILYKYSCADTYPSGNIHWVMKDWKRFFAIDTNTQKVEGVQASITSVIQGYVIDTEKGVGIYKLDTYYTEANFNVTGNPETFAICKLIAKVSKEFAGNENLRFGIITDSELGLIDRYNARTEFLLPGLLLPPNFHIMYATAEAGRDTFMSNKMMAMCEQVASKALATIKIKKSALVNNGE
jgi:hypothetical protein